VYDGDTFTAIFDFYGLPNLWRHSFRLLGIDTPELKLTMKDKEGLSSEEVAVLLERG